jgi:hypothetical protein
MDEKGFDNIARRVGGLRTRRDALKAAGCGTAAAIFAALGLENSALAQVTVQNHCRALGTPCTKASQCCGFRRRSTEIRCKPITGRSGTRCCGQARASCDTTDDCCELYECNQSILECQRI